MSTQLSEIGPVSDPDAGHELFPTAPGRYSLGGVPGGMEARILGDAAAAGRDILFVACDDVALSRAAAGIRFFAPRAECLVFPAWDCLPYDRVSPRSEIVSQRLDTLCRLAAGREGDGGRIVLTTVSAFLQKLPPRDLIREAVYRIETGSRVDPGELTEALELGGYVRTQTVMEPGEYAVRGGIVDVFPAGATTPSRLDFFGDELDTIRAFDAADQRTLGDVAPVKKLVIAPVSEALLSTAAISRFRERYRTQFGTSGDDDPLYQSVSEGRRYIGMEHWLPFFHDRLEALADYLPDATVVLDHQAEQARDARLDLVAEYYTARLDHAEAGDDAIAAGPPYRPVPPGDMFLDAGELDASLATRPVFQLSPFAAPEDIGDGTWFDAGGRAGRDFADIRVQPDANVFDAVRDFCAEQNPAGRRVVIAAYSAGSADRLLGLLHEHGLEAIETIGTWAEAERLPRESVALAAMAIETGFRTDDAFFLSEQDILGERLIRAARRRIKAENFIAEASSLSESDLVVHADHGIGKFDGLETISVAGSPHDCLRLIYAGGDKLFLPVENIEVISRYGSDDAGAQLDRLGGAAWQARKSKLKERIREIAARLIEVAAARELRKGERIELPDGVYDEFCARFPYSETEDQARAIADVLDDLMSGRSADRLVCGDVGFGKTEVALRAAFATAMEGKQVTVVVPTTLLARQHFQTFRERFQGYPVRVEQISRMVPAAQVRKVKDGLRDGTVDIVIGTHALLAKDVGFKDLGLLVVDEEQHFGVAHKERLKQLKTDVHVLTLTATPIPRTLQMALTGIRDMSLITTPPVDRLAVRTYVLPFDPVIVREAIMRERFRGGQTFYVCPRVADLAEVEKNLRKLVPEVQIGIAHGKLSPSDLEDTIGRFYDGAFDVLLSTNIVESGLDLPSVNTMIIHRADMFGLAQLYQLRGRVGRSKIRAYAYLTLPPDRKLTPAAVKRLEVMQTLDTLGAGFSLASHDLDIRGAGNLLGDEQSGHIKEVGVELYQHMLEEAVAEAKGGAGEGAADEDWSPQIGLGMPVLIPDWYVADLDVRMGLYRRLAWVADAEGIDAFAAELIDRFGPLPGEVDNLLKVVDLKNRCKRAGVDKIDAGPKGAVVGFRNDEFANPAGLVQFITSHVGTASLRPDHKLVFKRDWETDDDRFDGVSYLVNELGKIAAADGKEPAAAR